VRMTNYAACYAGALAVAAVLSKGEMNLVTLLPRDAVAILLDVAVADRCNTGG